MKKQENSIIKKLLIPIILLITFWTIAILLWKLKDNVFLLFNFGYIGTTVALGIGAYGLLPRKRKPIARRLAHFLIGTYLLGFVGFYFTENLQIEGFFFYLLGGAFGGSVIHYLVAKLINPVIIGRGWCGWACWTSMILDYLPYKKNVKGRIASGWEKIRYFHFGFSILLVLILWLYFNYGPENANKDGLLWLIIGNVIYFSSGIILAFVLKDNRAFCKYICPVTAILKFTTKFALFKMDVNKEKCTNCKSCATACPMDINIYEYIKNGDRVLSTECIICQTCTTECPQNALSMSSKFDIGGKEILNRR